MCGNDSTRGRGREQTKWAGNRRYMAFHGCQDQAAARNEIVSDAADPCQLLDDGWSGVGATAVFAAATLR